MTISINNLVNSSGIVVNASTAAGLAIRPTVLTDSQLLPATDNNRSRIFVSSADVGSYFGLNSDEYKFSLNYFAGYVNSLTLPKSIVFARYVSNITSAYIYSGKQLTNTVVGAIKALATPAFTANINGEQQVLTLVQSDFASCTGLTDVANVLQTKLVTELTSCTVKIIGTNQMCITAPATNSDTSTISYCVGNVADLLALSSAYSPVVSQGSAGGNVMQNMSNIVNSNPNFVFVTYVKRLANDNLANNYPISVGLTEWASSMNNQYIVALWEGGTNPLIALSSPEPETVNLATALVNAGYGSVAYSDNGNLGITYNAPIILTYNGNQLMVNSSTGDEYGGYTAFMPCSIGGSTNYTATNGAVAYSAKTQTGLDANVSNTGDYLALLSNGYNCYGSFASKTATFDYTENGEMGGIYLWVDNLVNALWLENEQQNQLAALLGSVGRLPYNASGQAMVSSVLSNVAQSAKNSGVIEVGNQFDAIQTQTIKQLFGTDITPSLTANGYYIYFPPVAPSDRTKRSDLKVMFAYTNGGAVIKITLNDVFVS